MRRGSCDEVKHGLVENVRESSKKGNKYTVFLQPGLCSCFLASRPRPLSLVNKSVEISDQTTPKSKTIPGVIP